MTHTNLFDRTIWCSPLLWEYQNRRPFSLASTIFFLNLKSTWFERVSMMVILLNCVTLGMYQPCMDDECQTNRCKILQVSRLTQFHDSLLLARFLDFQWVSEDCFRVGSNRIRGMDYGIFVLLWTFVSDRARTRVWRVGIEKLVLCSGNEKIGTRGVENLFQFDADLSEVAVTVVVCFFNIIPIFTKKLK